MTAKHLPARPGADRCRSDVDLVRVSPTDSPPPLPQAQSPPSHLPQAAGDVATMPDPELAALASDIRELSLIFSADNENWRPPQSNQGPVQDGLSKTLSHFSNILSIDTEEAVALVGSMTKDNITAIVVQSITSESPEPSHQPVIAHSITPSLRDVDDILVDEPTDVEGCVAECLALFAARQECRVTSRMIVEWVVARGWYTLQTRLQRSKDNFRYGDVFDLMENWAPAIYDDVPRRAIPLPPVSEVYLKYGLNVCRADGETTFSLCRDTASTLINTLGRTFKDVRRTIEDDSVDFATAVESIADSLLFLCYVVDHKDVQRVFTHTTLTRVLDPKYFRYHTKNVAQALEDGWDPPTTADCEDDSDYALRYLRMLTSSATAVLSVASPNTLRLLAAAKVTVISLLKPPHAPDSACDRVTQSVVDVIQRRLTSGSEVCEEAMKWVRDLAARKSDHESSCHVHAEAGVMALACDTSACRKGHGECEMVNPEVTICVAPGQRCCALCFRLGELLNARLEDNLQFVLPGTHDVILPWDPPLFGIPKSVMRQLRDELRDTLADVTIQVAERNVSIRNSAFRRT